MIQLLQRAQTLTPKGRQRVYYTDFNRNFDLNPITQNVVILQNEDSIRNSLENLIFTNHGERFYHDEIGSDINHLLFEPVDDVTTSSLKEAIEQCIRYEPRVGTAIVTVTPNAANHTYIVSIAFTDILNQPVQIIFPLTARVR